MSSTRTVAGRACGKGAPDQREHEGQGGGDPGGQVKADALIHGDACHLKERVARRKPLKAAFKATVFRGRRLSSMQPQVRQEDPDMKDKKRLTQGARQHVRGLRPLDAEEELLPEQHERMQPSFLGRRAHPLLEQPPPQDAQPGLFVILTFLSDKDSPQITTTHSIVFSRRGSVRILRRMMTNMIITSKHINIYTLHE